MLSVLSDEETNDDLINGSYPVSLTGEREAQDACKLTHARRQHNGDG